MSDRLLTAGLVLGSVLAAWLRFDAGSLVFAWGVVLLSLVGALAGWMVHARKLPPVHLPPDVQELGTREELTPGEEARFADGLRAWHRQQQRKVWREIERHGPGPQVMRRATFYYLWLALIAVVLLPTMAVPSGLLPELPRFVIVLFPLAAGALLVAVPLGVRDYKRATHCLTHE